MQSLFLQRRTTKAQTTRQRRDAPSPCFSSSRCFLSWRYPPLCAGKDRLQALFKKGKNLFAWDISMLEPLETHLLKKADPALKSKPYQRICLIAAQTLAEERKLALPIVRKQSFGLGIRANPSTKNHSCQSRRRLKTSQEGI